jgi:tetratricopeptide (TPR) repeat protein
VPGDSGLAFQFLAIQLFALRREQGKLAELQPVVQSFIDQYPALRWRVGLAYVLCDVGRLDEARAEFERMASDGFAELPLDFNWLISATILAEVCARLKDAQRAPALYQLLLPHADRMAVIGDTVACNGSVARYLALLARTMGDWDVAERHFRAALDMNERMGARPFVAHTAQEFAEMLLERSGPGDRARAKELLDRALDEARTLGLVRVEERAQALRQQMGENAP